MTDSLVLAPELIPEFRDRYGMRIPPEETVCDFVTPHAFAVGALMPRRFIEYSEDDVDLETVRARAEMLNGNMSIADGKRMLGEQDKIPVSFDGFGVVLPGTELYDWDGNIFVAYLKKHEGRWILDYIFHTVFCGLCADQFCFACIPPEGSPDPVRGG